MDPKRVVTFLKEIRSAAKNLQRLRRKFACIDHNTTDVELAVIDGARLALHVRNNILTPYQLFRVRWGRPSLYLLKGMREVASELKEVNRRIAEGWNYPANQMQREADDETVRSDFARREAVYYKTRDDCYLLCELGSIASELERWFGSHEHFLTDRELQWLNVGIGFFAGTASSLVVAYLLHLLRLNR